MVLAAPEFIIAERVELVDQIEVAAELQHRMLADRVMRGEEGSEFQACHGFLSGSLLLFDWLDRQATCWKAPRQSLQAHGDLRRMVPCAQAMDRGRRQAVGRDRTLREARRRLGP